MNTGRSMAPNAIFFDLDGTLLDTRPGIFRCFRLALAEMGLPVPSDEQLFPLIGPPLKSGFALFIKDAAAVDKAVEMYRVHYRAGGMYEASVYPGIADALRVLAESYNLYCVTSKAEIFAERIISRFGLDQFIQRTHGADIDGTRAEKEPLIRYVLNEEKIFCRNAVMIGDRRFDIEGARANSVHSVGVLWGFGSEDELRTAGADALVKTPSALVKSIDSVFGIPVAE
jgi:phosphoglycolate phosphatase